MRIKCLSVAQPWAWAICHAGKRVENRTWSTRYRGPVAIHASKSGAFMESGISFLMRLGLTIPPPTLMPRGAVVAVANLVDVVDPSGVPVGQRRWTEGPRCWVLDRVRALREPAPMAGQRGLFEIELSEGLCLAAPVSGRRAATVAQMLGLEE